MAGIIENKDGQILIDLKVIEEFAGHAAMDCFGIVGMSSINVKDSVAKILKGDSLRRGVSVQADREGNLIIFFHIIVAYGVSIRAVADNLCSTVKYQVEDFTGMRVRAINVFVDGVRVID